MSPKKKPVDKPAPPPSRALRVLSFSVKWVAGIREAAIQPDGRAVLFEGRNASGKTSWLSALLATIGGGPLATLAHIGAPEGVEPETVLVLGGEDTEYRVTKKGAGSAKVLRRVGDSQAFANVARPQEFLGGLFDSQMANPVRWLRAPQKQQHTELLEALDLEMDEKALARLLSDVELHLNKLPAGLHPLAHLSLVRDQLFSARTGVNRDAKGKAEAAEQIRRELPAKAPGHPGAEIAELEDWAEDFAGDVGHDETQAAATERDATRTAQTAHDEAVERIRSDFKEFAGVRRGDHERRAAEFRAQAERKIAAEAASLEQEIEEGRTTREVERVALDEAQHDAEVAAHGDRAKADVALQGRRQQLTEARERLATLREQAEAATRFGALDEQAGGFEGDAQRHRAESNLLTAALDRLDAFRLDLVKELPIPGLEIDGTEIKVDGVPLAMVNKARRVEVAAKIALARAAKYPLKLVFLDDLEHLDAENREALLSYLAEHGVQAFGGCVTDEDPLVEYVGAVTGGGR